MGAVDWRPLMAFPSDNPDVRCFRCGYSLAGLRDDAVCPECALPIAVFCEPRALRSWTRQRVRFVRARLRDLMMIDAGLIAAVLAFLLALFDYLVTLRIGPDGLFFVLAVVVFYATVNVATGVEATVLTLRATIVGAEAVSLRRAATAWRLIAGVRVVLLIALALSLKSGPEWVSVPSLGLFLGLACPEWLARTFWLRALQRLAAIDPHAKERKTSIKVASLIGLAWCVPVLTTIITPFIGNYEAVVFFVGSGVLLLLCSMVFAIVSMVTTERMRVRLQWLCDRVSTN